MSADLASLYIKVDSSGVVTASKDLSALEGHSRKVETATQSVSSGFEKLRGVVSALAASYALLKMAQYVQDATLAAARYETLGVVMRVVGNNAGYTGAQMETFSKGLQKSGISMNESRQSLTRMVQAQLDLNQSSKLARVAQDAAVIGNINSSEAFQRLVYGIQSGQVEMLRTIGINVNFEASYQKVAKATGRVVSSFTESEKSQIRMNAAMDAGAKIAGTYESAMETAGKQLMSLPRHLENLKVLFGAAFTPALAEIIQTITGAVTDMNGELSGESKQKIEEWGNAFRLTIIDIEAEFMRLGMFVDKVGGTLTSAQMLLYGPGAALGVESIKKRFEAAAQANIDLEARYKATEKELERLADRYIKLEQAMTPAGKAQVKAAQDALEAARLTAAAAGGKEGPVIDAAAAKRAAKAAADAEILYIKQIQEAEAEKNKDVYEFAQWLNGEYATKEKERYESEQLGIKQTEAAEAEWNKARQEFAEWENGEGKRTTDRLQAERDIYSDLRGYETQYYEASMKLIKDQADAYRKKGVDEVAVAARVANETEKEELRKLKASANFADGVSAYLKELERDHLTFGKAGYEIIKTFAESSKTALSTILFDSIKTGTFDAKAVFESFTDTMLKKFTDTIAEMVAEAAVKPILMNFAATWTASSSAILGIINKGWDLWNSYSSSSSTSLALAEGGEVPGKAAYPGNSAANDTVWARLSPGEFVVPRTGVNANTRGELEYIRRNGQVRGYADGGEVPRLDATEVQRTFDYGRDMARSAGVYSPILDKAARDYIQSGKYEDHFNSIAQRWALTKGSLMAGEASLSFVNPLNPFLVGSGNMGDGMYSMAWRDGQVTKYEADTDMSWAPGLIKGTVKGGLIALAGKAGGPAGAGAAAAFLTYSESEDFTSALINGVIAAALTYYGAQAAKGFGGMTTQTGDVWGVGMGGAGEAGSGLYAGMGGAGEVGVNSMQTSWLDGVLDVIDSIASPKAKSWAIDQVISFISKAAFGGKGGTASYSFAGAEGDLSWLYRDMLKIAPTETALNIGGFAKGGIATGPESGYTATLHGTELIVSPETKYPATVADTAGSTTSIDVPHGPVNPAAYGYQVTPDAYNIALTQRKLEIQLMELQGNAAEVLVAQREDELILLDESAKATALLIYKEQDRIKAEEEMAKLEAEANEESKKRADIQKQQGALDIQLLDAQGKSSEALAERRAAELAVLAETDQALADTQAEIWRLNDAAEAAKTAASALAAAMAVQGRTTELQIQLLEAQGKAEEALSARRSLALNALDNDDQRRLQQDIWTLTDAAEALKKSADAAAAAQSAYLSAVERRQALIMNYMKVADNEEIKKNFGMTKEQYEALYWGMKERELAEIEARGKKGSDEWFKLRTEILNHQLEEEQKIADLKNKRYDLDITLLGALGEKEAALAMQRMRELEAMDESLRTTQLQIWAVEDLNSSIEKFRNRAEQISGWLDQTTRSDLAPVQSAQAWELQYATLRKAAMAEGATDEQIAAYMAYASEYLAFQKQYGTEGSYQAIYDAIVRDMTDLGTATEAALSVAEKQLEIMKSQVQATIDAGNRQAELLQELIDKSFGISSIVAGPGGRVEEPPMVMHGLNGGSSSRSFFADPDAFAKSLAKYISTTDGGSAGGDIHVSVTVDGREIGNVVAKQIKTNPNLQTSIKRLN